MITLLDTRLVSAQVPSQISLRWPSLPFPSGVRLERAERGLESGEMKEKSDLCAFAILQGHTGSKKQRAVTLSHPEIRRATNQALALVHLYDVGLPGASTAQQSIFRHQTNASFELSITALYPCEGFLFPSGVVARGPLLKSRLQVHTLRRAGTGSLAHVL